MDSRFLALTRVITLGPLFFDLLAIDRYVFRSRNPFLGFPRNLTELFNPPDHVFRLLQREGVIPAGARCISCEHVGGADTEPDKSVARIDLVYSTPASPREELRVFVKLPSARQYKLYFKALLTAASPDNKEVAFHNVILPELARQAGGREKLGFAAPKNLYAAWSRPFERSILIQECIDMDRFHSRPDWMDADPRMVERIIDSATDLHRRTWQLRDMPPKVLGKFLEKRGVDWLDPGVQLYARRAPASLREIWKAIQRRAAREPVTISHGDCRMGNCLFTSDYSEVILTDWEVNSITFYLWDITYCMTVSFTPEDRRKHEEAFIRRYLDGLRENPQISDVPSFESAMELHKISMICIQVFAWLISRFGGVGETQGNSDEDMHSWKEKLDGAMADVLGDQAGLARALDVDVSLVKRFREDFYSGKILSAD